MNGRLYIFSKAYSMEAPGHFYGGLLVRDGLIKQCLRPQAALELKKKRPAGIEIIDYTGYYCLPGFFDSHTHFMQTGYNSLAVRFESCRSIEEVKGLVADAAREAAGGGGRSGLFGGVVVGHGFDESSFAEKRMPQRSDLDYAAGKTPVFISRVDHHSSVFNTAFMKLYPDFFARLDEETLRTGILRREPNYAIKGMLINGFGDAIRRAAYESAENAALRAGITSLCALEGGAISGSGDVYFIDGVIKNRLNKLNLVLFDQSGDIERAIELGLPRTGGCLLVDGSIGSKTAAVSVPYKNAGGARGAMYLDRRFMAGLIEKAQKANLQLAFHAIGDAAINALVDSYEKLLLKCGAGGARNPLRHRIEHFEMASAADIGRAARLGIVLSMQPVFETLWGGSYGMYAERLGRARALRTNRFASIIKAGGIIAGGSDSDVTPMSPIAGIHALLNLPNEVERVGLFEAVSIFTRNGAYANFMERERGSIAPGKCADLTVVDRDIFAPGPMKALGGVGVMATIIGGEIRYRADECGVGAKPPL